LSIIPGIDKDPPFSAPQYVNIDVRRLARQLDARQPNAIGNLKYLPVSKRAINYLSEMRLGCDVRLVVL
jgi:hypothetical protein